MVKKSKWWILLSLALSACGGMPASVEDDGHTPISQQTATGNARMAAKAHTDLGMAYLSEGRPDVALDEAHKAIESDSSYPLGYNLLGVVQMQLENSRAAEENLRRALSLAPNDPEINNNYGWFLCQNDRQKESIPYFVTASKNTLYAYPTKPLTNAALCSMVINDDKSAEDFLLQALRADPRNGNAYFLLAEINFRTDRLTDARTRLSEAHRLNLPTAQSVWLGVRIERRLGDKEAEADLARQLRREFPDSREFQLLKQGRYSER
jgi:type IV pilus assembly protein PilF